MSTQNAKIEKYLRGTNRSLTVAQARSKFKIGSLTKRISEMRKAGLKVNSNRVLNGKAKYTIELKDKRGSTKMKFCTE